MTGDSFMEQYASAETGQLSTATTETQSFLTDSITQSTELSVSLMQAGLSTLLALWPLENGRYQNLVVTVLERCVPRAVSAAIIRFLEENTG